MKQTCQLYSYNNLTVTPQKVHDLLMLPKTQSVNEERVYTYLKTMIGNMSILMKFIVFFRWSQEAPFAAPVKF